MKKGAALLIALVLSISSLCAEMRPTLGSYLFRSFCNDFAIEGSALYWRTCRDDRKYAATIIPFTPTTPNEFSYSIVKPKPTWGWRVKATFSPGCYFTDAEYAYFKERDKDTTDNTSGLMEVTYFNNPVPSITATVENFYQRVRGRAGYFITEKCRGSLYAFGGAGWLYLKEKDTLLSPPAAGIPLQVSQTSRFNGAAFEAGIGGNFRVFRRFNLLAEFNGVGALGSRTFNFKLNTDGLTPNALENKYPDETICIPGYDMRFEANYCLGSCFLVTLAVGYEHHQFFNTLVLNPLFAPPGLTALYNPAYQPEVFNIGYSGVYISAKVDF